MKTQLLVFSDLDGTLLDHHTYSFAAAENTLKKLQKLSIPVIPTTSKTYAELLQIRQELDLSTPFIVENGAAVCLPHGFLPQKPASTVWQHQHWVRQFTSVRHYWVKAIKKIEGDFPNQFMGFSSMSTEQLVEVTGLSSEQAKLASQRQNGEPLLWLGTDEQKQRFFEALRHKGIFPLEGGRFIHVCGECDKGAAMMWLKSEYQRQHPDVNCMTVALGDGNNDIAMLEAADIAVCIRSPSHNIPALNRTKNLFISEKLGPEGWSEVMEKLITQYT